jgi:hypothetical protein
LVETFDELWKWDQNGPSDQGARMDSGITGRIVLVHWRCRTLPDQGYANVSFHHFISKDPANTTVRL